MKHTALIEDDEIALQLQALSHPARLKILRLLACRDACCCKDVVGEVALAQSTVSQHLKVLVESGLVTYRPDRQSSRYSLDRAALATIAASVQGLVDACCVSPLALEIQE
jgi:ArsR family transcriptional regulator